MNRTLLCLLSGLLYLASCTQAGNSNPAANNKNNSTAAGKEIIVDVRTPEEWNEEHAPCAVNYPLDQIESKIAELKQYDHIVVVCKAGGRAESAKEMLENAGIKNVENLGAWQNITCN